MSTDGFIRDVGTGSEERGLGSENAAAGLCELAPCGTLERFVPALGRDRTGRAIVVRLVRRSGAVGAAPTAAWEHRFADEDDACRVFDWMSARPHTWEWWGAVAEGLRPRLLDRLILAVEAAEAEAAARERARQEEEAINAREITLYYYDPKGKRPALGLERGDEKEPFLRMQFDEKWERDRVMDWLRWQRDSFAGWHDQVRTEGALWLERLVLAGMRDGEKALKKRGLTNGGRRPLRFWRGE